MRAPTRSDIAITCVVPTHGRPVHLRRALESVADQTLACERVIVESDIVDEATRTVIAEFATKLPLAYGEQDVPVTQRTAGRSRNAGAAKAESEYVAFLDDDDIWVPHHLEYLARVVDDYRPEPGIVVSWTRLVQGDRQQQGHRLLSSVRSSDVVRRNPGLTGSNFMIRRDAFIQLGGFDEALRVANDRDFLLRVLDAQIILGVSEHETVLQVIHASGQLTSRRESRATGLESFHAKHEARFGFFDKRELRRILHSIRRVSAPTRSQRLRHGVLQLFNDSPTRLLPVLARRLRRRHVSYD